MSKKLKKKVPVLRFPEFEGELQLTYLCEILDFKNGINADKSQYGKGYKFINVLDIINDSPIYYETILGSVEITEEEFIKNDVQYGDVLFQRSSEIREEAGQSNIYLDKNQNATFGGFVIRGRPKVKFEPIYFNYLLKTQSVRKEITDRSGGSTRFNIGQNSLSEVSIFISNSLAEQEKIASFLGAVDTRITQLRRKQELLQTYKRGVMQKIFSQKIRFKQPDGSPFPDWEKKKLGKIASFFSGGTPSSTEAIYYSGEIPFIKSGEISSGKTEQYLSKEGLENSSAKIVEIGDLLYALYGATSGEVAISKINGAINQAVLCIRSKAHKTVYLFNYLKSQKNIITGKYLQGGQGNLSADIMKGLIAPTPCIAEQEKIADFLTAIDRKIEALSRQIDQTEQFKKGLLRKMFV